MSGRVDFSFGFQTYTNGQPIQRTSDQFNVYILGSYSGANPHELLGKIRKIDIDHFDAVLSQIAPALTLANGINLTFANLDDFHPDAWIAKVPLLSDLIDLKKRLLNPSTAEQAAKQIQALFPTAPTTDTVEQQTTAENQDDLIERLLGRKPDATSTNSGSIDKYLSQLVAPHITHNTNPQHHELIAVIDATLSQFIKSILHHPDFQSLESLWRATESLVHDADEQRVYLIDINEAELSACATNGSYAVAEKIQQHLQTFDDQPNVFLICDFVVSNQNKAILDYCSHITKQLGACLLASISVDIAQQALADEQSLNAYLSGVATDHVVLTFPRYLQRLPYGNKRDPIASLEFEECSAIPQSHELLWANAAFLSARTLLRNESSPAFFDDAPAFSFSEDGDSKLQPATETVLNEAQANALIARGIMPVISYKQRQGVCLMGLATLT